MSNTYVTDRVNLSDAVPLPVPLVVYVDVTNHCNFTCPFCPTGHKLQRTAGNGQGMISEELYRKIIAELGDLTRKTGRKIKKFCLYWLGEPMLNKRLPEMIRMAKDANICDQVMISTNGSLLWNDRIRLELINSGIDLVSFSMYGTSNEEYLSVNRSFTFDEVAANAGALVALRDAMGLAKPKVLMKYFEPTPQVDSAMKHLKNNCDAVVFEEPFNWSEDYSTRTGMKVTHQHPGPLRYCPSAWFVSSIGWDGTVCTCCSDWGWHTKVGDLRTQTFEEVWKGQDLHLFRRRIVEGRQDENPACRGCTYYKAITNKESSLDTLIETQPERALAALD